MNNPAKISKPSNSLRESLTKAYAKKVDETKRARGQTSMNVDFHVTEINETVEAPTVPLMAPVRLADAPTLSLKSLLPEGFKGEVNDDETIRANRLDFLILYRKPDKTDVVMDIDDPKIDWQIPNQETFEKVMDLAICDFTEDDPDRLEIIEFGKVGWNTGVGLVGFRTDNMDLVSEFAGIVKGLIIPELQLRFCLAPRKLLMDKYALTCYFNSSFKMQKPKNLIYWILKFNPTLKGKAELFEVRKYPSTHENTKRAGAKIITFEGDQAQAIPGSCKTAHRWIRKIHLGRRHL